MSECPVTRSSYTPYDRSERLCAPLNSCYSRRVKYLLVGLVLVVLYIVMGRRQFADKASEPFWIVMTGVTGTADQTFTSEGTVSVRGEIWKATARAGIIHKGDRVRVVAIKPGLILEVEAVEAAGT
jgi:membrane-bound ClpP family serine protease